MSSPNKELMERYGTDRVYEEKLAGQLPIAARIAAGVLSAGAVASHQHRQQEQALQAALLNARFQELLGRRLASTEQAFRHTPVPLFVEAGSHLPLGLTDGMVRLASAAGQDIAYLEKDAAGVIESLTNFVRRIRPRRAGAARTSTTSAAGQVKPPPPPPPTPAPPAQAAARTATTAPPPTPQAPAPPPQAQVGQPQAPGFFDKMKARLAPELENGAWKRTLPMAGAVALGGYGAYRAAKGAFNWLGQEPASYTYNAGGSSPAAAVNQYGVPDRSAPFAY